MKKINLKPRVVVDGKGRVLIPKWLRKQLQIEPGDFFEVELYEEGKVLLTALKRPKQPPQVKGSSQNF